MARLLARRLRALADRIDPKPETITVHGHVVIDGKALARAIARRHGGAC